MLCACKSAPPEHLAHTFFAGRRQPTRDTARNTKPSWEVASAPAPALDPDPLAGWPSADSCALAGEEELVQAWWRGSAAVGTVIEKAQHPYVLDQWAVILAAQDPMREVEGLWDTAAVRVVVVGSAPPEAVLRRAGLSGSDVDLVVDATAEAAAAATAAPDAATMGRNAVDTLTTFLQRMHPCRRVWAMVEWCAVPLLAASLHRLHKLYRFPDVTAVIALRRSDLYPSVGPSSTVAVRQRVLRAWRLLEDSCRPGRCAVADVVVLDTTHPPSIVQASAPRAGSGGAVSEPPCVVRLRPPVMLEEDRTTTSLRRSRRTVATADAAPGSRFGSRILYPPCALDRKEFMGEAQEWVRSFGRAAPSVQLVAGGFVGMTKAADEVYQHVLDFAAGNAHPVGFADLGLVSVCKEFPGVGATSAMRWAAVKLSQRDDFVVLWLQLLPSSPNEMDRFVEWVSGMKSRTNSGFFRHIALFLNESNHTREQESDLPPPTLPSQKLSFLRHLDKKWKSEPLAVVASWDETSADTTVDTIRGVRPILESVHAHTTRRVDMSGILDNRDVGVVCEALSHLGDEENGGGVDTLANDPAARFGRAREEVGQWGLYPDGHWPSKQQVLGALDHAKERALRAPVRPPAHSALAASPRHILSFALAGSRGAYLPVVKWVESRCREIESHRPLWAILMGVSLTANFCWDVPGLPWKNVTMAAKAVIEREVLANGTRELDRASAALWDGQRMCAPVHPFVAFHILNCAEIRGQNLKIPGPFRKSRIGGQRESRGTRGGRRRRGNRRGAMPARQVDTREMEDVVRVASLVNAVGLLLHDVDVTTTAAADDMFVKRHHLCLWPSHELYVRTLLPFSPLVSLFTDAQDLCKESLATESSIPQILRDREAQLRFVLGDEAQGRRGFTLRPKYRDLIVSRALAWWGARTLCIPAMDKALVIAKDLIKPTHADLAFDEWRYVCQYKRGAARARQRPIVDSASRGEDSREGGERAKRGAGKRESPEDDKMVGLDGLGCLLLHAIGRRAEKAGEHVSRLASIIESVCGTNPSELLKEESDKNKLDHILANFRGDHHGLDAAGLDVFPGYGDDDVDDAGDAAAEVDSDGGGGDTCSRWCGRPQLRGV